jgi:hypothetical protein
MFRGRAATRVRFGVTWIPLVLGACRGAPGRVASEDSDPGAVDTARADTAVDTASMDTAPLDSADTGPMTPAPTGRVEVRGALRGATYAWECVDAGLAGGWVDALGNVAGSVTCASGDEHALALTFTRGSAGAWTDPGGGVDFVWTLPDGERVHHGAEGLTPTRWSVAITRWERLTLATIALDATLAGAWAGTAGEDARVDATLAVVLPG